MRHRIRLLLSAFAVLAASACTTMGPTPATTGFTARPMPRAGLDVQVGLVPGHNLSSSVVESPDGNSIKQVSAAAQYDELIGIPGLVLGARLFGNEGDTPVEPVIGYRRELGDGVASLAGFLFGTHAEHEEYGASYEMTRLGGELAGDVRILENRWVEPHVFGGFNVHHLSADGTYCTGASMQWAEDCPEPDEAPKPVVSSTVEGTFPSAHVGIAAEIMRHRDSWFHGGRVALMAAGGVMPHVESTMQTDNESYFAFGLTLSVGIGSGDE
jgi:hypothetical protein